MQHVKFKENSMSAVRYGMEDDLLLINIDSSGYAVLKCIKNNRIYPLCVAVTELEPATPTVVLPV